jgi:hypothetical protein
VSSQCVTCEKSKAPLTCGICAAQVCKACAEFANREDVALLSEIPSYFAHGAFCRECFEQKIRPEIESYNELVARAQEIDLFYKTQSKESRFVRRSEKPIHVKDCVDKETAILKLAFQAAQGGFNILVDVETRFDKIRMEGWQTSKCHASAIPATIDPQQLNRRFVGSPN